MLEQVLESIVQIPVTHCQDKVSFTMFGFGFFFFFFFFTVLIITIPLSLNIHLFTQNTRLVSKVSCPAWPLPSLSTVVLIPSLVGSLILSEGTLEKKRSLFLKWSFNLSFQSISVFASDCGGLWFAFNNLTHFVSYSLLLSSNLTHFSLTLTNGSSTVKLTAEFSLHSYSPFLICSSS